MKQIKESFAALTDARVDAMSMAEIQEVLQVQFIKWGGILGMGAQQCGLGMWMLMTCRRRAGA